MLRDTPTEGTTMSHASRCTAPGLKRLGGALAPVAIIAVWAAGAAPASAAQRYASPSGSALSPCSQLAPCDLKTAVEGAGGADEVIVNPGTYTPSGNVLGNSAISIHGAVGQPRPVIQFTGAYGMNRIR